MESTRRVWIVLAVAGGGTVLAAVFSNGLLIGIPVASGLWLVAHWVAFRRAVRRIHRADPAMLDQSLADGSLQTGDSTTLRVRFTSEGETTPRSEAVLELMIPPALDTDEPHLRLVSEGDATAFDVPIRAPLAGSFEIGAPRIHLSSARGLFHETVQVGNEVSILVEPRVRTTDAARVDRTHLFVDRRASMRDGRPGRTKLDYAREIGLALTSEAADDKAPLRLSFVDGDTTARSDRVFVEEGQYHRARWRLNDLTPDEDATASDGSTISAAVSGPEESNPLRVRRDAARRAEACDGDDAFSRTLAPYFETMSTYSERMTNEPLFSSVNEYFQQFGTDGRFVIVTDDSNREELSGTARLASVRGAELSIFVLPSALFADGDIPKVDALVEEHRDCQSFVGELNKNEGVTAFEAGPHERPTARSERSARSVRQ